MTDQLDAVARALANAIWGGTPLAEDAWELLSAGEQETYRGWARAAIDALGLTEERGVQIPGDPIRHLNSDQRFGDYSPSWGRFTRLVSRWVREDNTNE